MTSRRTFLTRALPPVALTVLAGGCGVVIGLGDYHEGAGGHGAGGSDTGACTPAKKASCYTAADPGTKDVGTCHAGEKTCQDDKTWGPCVGQVLPTSEDDCNKNLDTTCDGVTTCPCVAGTTIDCYDGDPATADKGICHGGKKTCDSAGQSYGPCQGEQLPAPTEDCTNTLDDNCNGVVNELCGCTPKAVDSCYSGPPATRKQGVCKDGRHTCNDTGSDYVETGCPGEVLPQAKDDCSNTIDEDCSGSYCSETIWAKDEDLQSGQTSFTMTVDSKDNIIVVGNGPFGKGITYANSGFVAKVKPTGETDWVRHYGNMKPFAVTVDASDNIYFGSIDWGETIDMSPCDGIASCTGVTFNGLAVVKLDSTGTAKWATPFADGADGRVSYFRLGAGTTGIYLVGQSSAAFTWGSSTITPPSGMYARAYFLGKIDQATGKGLWAKDISYWPDTSNGPVPTDSQGIGYIIQTNTNVTPLSYNASTFDTNGTGSSNQTIATGNLNSTVMTLDKSGVPVIAANYTNALTVGSASVPTPPLDSNGYPLTGLIVIRSPLSPITATSSVLFKVAQAGVSFSAVQIAGTPDGGFAVTGSVTGKPDFGGGAIGPGNGLTNPFVLKLDSTGKYVWARVFGTSGAPSGMGTDSLGNIIMGGANFTGLDFSPAHSGSGNLPNANVQFNDFLVKFAGQ